MGLLERILVATDFSPGADDALATALLVAKQFRSQVALIHVIPSAGGFRAQHRATVRETVRERLEDVATRIRAEAIHDVVEARVLEDAPDFT